MGYESDLGIRDNPGSGGYAAGYNEQSLFLTRGGRLVSIIRGREKLGRVAGSPKDTWFFRSVSDDQGETWSKPEPTNVAGTGAAGIGAVLPDGSFLLYVFGHFGVTEKIYRIRAVHLQVTPPLPAP